MAEEYITIDRDYVDTFSVKDFAVENVMPKFFPGITPTNLTTGTLGMITEYVGTITEDSFNTGSSLVAEGFPTRARMESSIYANAAVFQLSNAFADAGRCDFLIIIPEKDIRNNFVHKPTSHFSYFYIDKETKIFVKDIPFVLDYDIEIRAMYRQTQKKWVYSAKYMMDEYTNSVSDVKDPYVRLRQDSNGLIALQVRLKQYERTVVEESIVDNATLNYSTVDVAVNGKLLGFDVLYKAPGDSDFHTQLKPCVIYSLPMKEPFCYFKMISDNIVQLSFTTKDAYFQPKFNSELKIIVYTTLGKDGNFEFYDGNKISLSKGTGYEYENSWLITASPISGSKGGKERMSMEGLQRLTVEGYTTANAITTEHDLAVYFNNYKHRYENEILPVKKRNDAVELLFSVFMYIKQDDYIFPTNTLNLDTNVQYLDCKEGEVYNIDPGFLFSYKGTDVYRIPVYYVITDGDGDKYDASGRYIDINGNYDSTKDITIKELRKKISAGYVQETDHSYWKLVGDDSRLYHLYDSTGQEIEDVDPISQEEMFQRFSSGELTYDVVDTGNRAIDFVTDFEKDSEARSAYVAYYPEYKTRVDNDDLSFDEYLFEYTFKDYKRENGIDTRRTIFNTDVEEFAKNWKFLFTNPFIITIQKDTGLISYFQSFISQRSLLDFVDENDDDAFIQFVTYTLQVERDITDEKRYHFKVVVLPSIPPTFEEGGYCDVIYNEEDLDQFILYKGAKPGLENFNKELLEHNRLRLILTFTNEGYDVGYMELIPTHFDSATDQVTFEGLIYTDDYITTKNTLRVIHVCPHCGHHILNSVNSTHEGKNYFCDNCGNLFKEGIINVREADSMLLPISNGIIRVTSLFQDPENEFNATDNEFVQYDDSYTGYIWTNIYNTQSDPILLLQPLEMMRGSITYKDYFVTGVDAMDCVISDIPLLKYSILAYKDVGMKVTDPLLSDDIGKFQYFMDAVLDNYEVLREAKQRMNGLHMDIKFYNTYGRSTNFDIGEDGEPIDTNNIAIYLDVWIIAGIDLITADKELKLFIKDYIETINDEGSNNLYVSNLIREIENNFTYVHHLKFRGINSYDTNYQAIINRKIKLEDMTKEERRTFVPDILVINTNNIKLYFHQDEL